MDNALLNILELSRDPMLAVADGRISLMNTAAKQVFPDCRLGDRAAEYIPDLVIKNPGSDFLQAFPPKTTFFTDEL